MTWGFRRRKQAAAGPGPGSARPDERFVLTVLAEELTQVSGQPWRTDGRQVVGPRSTVLLTDEHGGSDGHLDLLFVADPARPAETGILDCVTGYGPTPEAKARNAVDTWVGTTGATLLALHDRTGRFGSHRPAGHPEGMPGWHAILGGITGLGIGPGHQAVQEWTAGHPVLRDLAPALLADGLPRDEMVGVKLFFGSAHGEETSEVRIQGVVAPVASAALAALPWPRPRDGGSFARSFILLVHRA